MRGLFGNQRQEMPTPQSMSGGALSREAYYQEAARQSRRSFAFMKYSPDRRSTTSMTRTREHTRQLALKLTETPVSPTAVQPLRPQPQQEPPPDDPFGSESSFQASFDSASVTSQSSGGAYDMDVIGYQQQTAAASRSRSRKASPASKNRRRPPRNNTEEAQQQRRAGNGRSTLPSNSSMQASFATPTAGGAAARRRMRNQMRQQQQGDELPRSDHFQTPPQSPHISVGSHKSHKSHRQAASVQKSPQFQRPPLHNTASPATTASSSVRKEDHFLDTAAAGGFTFDAFGLDASQVEQEVNEAMQELAGSHPDLSLFFEDEEFPVQPWGDDTSSSSCASSGSFVDGFRVTLPLHIRNSPTNSERSSLTNSTTTEARTNMFKEQAGFFQSKRHNNKNPHDDDEEWPSPRKSPSSRSTATSRTQQSTPTQQQPVPALPRLWPSPTANNETIVDNAQHDFQQFQRQRASLEDSTMAAATAAAATWSKPHKTAEESSWGSSTQQASVEDSSQTMPAARAATWTKPHKTAEESSWGSSIQQASVEDSSQTMPAARAATWSKPHKTAYESSWGRFTQQASVEDSSQTMARAAAWSKPQKASDEWSSSTQPTEEKKDESLEKVGDLKAAWERLGAVREKKLTRERERQQLLDTSVSQDEPQEEESPAEPSAVEPTQPFLERRKSMTEYMSAMEKNRNTTTVQRTYAKHSSFTESPVKTASPKRLPAEKFAWKPPQEQSPAPQTQNRVPGAFPATFPAKPTVSDQPQQRVEECSQQRSSFASQKERLRSTAAISAKSEGGADVRHGEVNAILTRLRGISSEKDRDTKSEGGGGGASFLAAVKLRKTAYPLAAEPTQQEPNEDTPSECEEPYESEEEIEEETPPERKLTYRERRELELQKEKEERSKSEEQTTKSSPERDVASLIRRRIAANRKSAVVSSPEKSTAEPELSSLRNRLKPVPKETIPRKEEASRAVEGKETPGDSIMATLRGRNYRTNDLERSSEEDSNQYGSVVEPSASYDSNRRVHRAVDDSDDVETPETDDKYLKNLMGLSASRSDEAVQSAESSKSMDYARAEYESRTISQHAEGNQRTSSQFEEGNQRTSSQFGEGNQRISQPESDKTPLKSNVTGASLASALAQKAKTQQRPTAAPVQNEAKRGHQGSPSRTAAATRVMLNAFLAGHNAVAKSQDEGDIDDSKKHPKVDSMAEPEVEVRKPGLPALKDDPKYERYFRMLSVGMPMDVVKHAMTQDGMDPSVMDGDHNKPVGIPLKDDPKYDKYFRMLKVGLPLEAVKHAMERDGIDSHVMDYDHNLPARTRDSRNDADEEAEKDTHRRARLHWNTLQKVRSNSLWAKIDKDPELEKILIDEDEFQELFIAELTPVVSPKGLGANRRRGAGVRVIDSKRANNGGIILARLKMTHDDMADAVDRIDENAMTAEQIEHIIEYLPTKEERRALEAYMLEGGQDAAEKFDGLCECEKFMVSMMTVKHAKRKVRALLFKLQFESCLGSLQEDAATVELACDELSNSIRLRHLLGIVLNFGNRLNTAGSKSKRKAGAFTLDSLLKLNQAKAFDKKTTFLQYVVLIVQRNNELLLRFKDDLPTLFKAEKVYWDQCMSDLEEVENQLENVRRIALYQARIAQTYRMSCKDQRDEDGTESLSEVSMSLEEEVEALRATPIGLFTLNAIKLVSSLRDNVDNTKAKFAGLLEYFGEEDSSVKHPHELFSILVRFCNDFDKAKEKVSADEKKKQREERKRQASARPPTHSKNEKRSNQPRVSQMQPNMSAVLRDVKRAAKNLTAAENPKKLERRSSAPTPTEPAHIGSVKNAPMRSTSAPKARSSGVTGEVSAKAAAPGLTERSQAPLPVAKVESASSRGYASTQKPSSSSARRSSPVNVAPHGLALAAAAPRDDLPSPPAPDLSISLDSTNSEMVHDDIPPGMQESGRFEQATIPDTISRQSSSSPSFSERSPSMREKARMMRRQRMNRTKKTGSVTSDPSSTVTTVGVESLSTASHQNYQVSKPAPMSPRSSLRHKRRMEQRRRLSASSSEWDASKGMTAAEGQ